LTSTIAPAKAWCGDFCFVPHDPIFYAGVLGRGWKETFDRSEPPTLLVTVGVNSYSHFFSFLIKTDPKHFTVGPRGNLGAHTCHNTSHLHPPPAPWPQGCAPLTPTCRYTPIHMHADRHRKMTTENVRPIDAAGGHRAQEHARWCRLRLRLRPGGRHGRCGCACRRVGATVRCCRAHTGPDRGRRSRQNVRMRQK
jgi:hypothetical protein